MAVYRLDVGIRAGIYECLGAAVGPANHERRGAVGAVGLEDLAIAACGTNLGPFDNQMISSVCVHVVLLAVVQVLLVPRYQPAPL